MTLQTGPLSDTDTSLTNLVLAVRDIQREMKSIGWVKGQNIAPQTITNANLDSSVTSGVPHGSILPVLPGYSSKIFYDDLDGKLYRQTADGLAWQVAVPTVDLTGQITNAQIVDAAITDVKIAVAAINNAHLQDNIISTGKLQALAVTTATLAANAVTTAKIAALAVTTAELAAGSVSTAKLQANSVTSNELAANSVIAGKIAAAVITSAELAANSVTAAKISVSQLSAITADVGDLSAGQLRNSGNTAGLLLSGSLPGGWTTYINFTATGTNPFVHHTGLDLNADGSARFAGNITAANFTGSGSVATITQNTGTIEFTGVPALTNYPGIKWTNTTSTRIVSDGSEVRFVVPASGGLVTIDTSMIGATPGWRVATIFYSGSAGPSGTALQGTLWARYGATRSLHVYDGGWQQIV